MADNITLDSIIEEAYSIKANLMPKSHQSSFFKVADTNIYEKWKYKTVRFLSVNYEGDRVCQDFANAVNNFVQLDLGTKAKFDSIIGVLESCKSIPEKVKSVTRKQNQTAKDAPIIINNTNSQSQSQSQSIQIFLEAIKDDLTGKQVKELKEIVANEDGDLEKAKPKLVDKIRSFGSDVASNIIANIITNPAIWSGV